MDKSKTILFCSIALSMFLLAGCTKAISLTEDESKLISSYAAGRILNYSEDSDGRITPPWITTAPAEPSSAAAAEQTEAPGSGNMTNSGNAAQSLPDNSQNLAPEAPVTEKVSLSDLYDITGLRMSYHSYEFCRQYPKNSAYSAAIAEHSEVLLAVKFSLTNTSNKTVSVDMSEKWDFQYPLTIQDRTFLPERVVLGVDNVLNHLKTNIKAGKSIRTVLIYALPKNQRNAKGITLNIQEGNRVAEVIIK